MTYASALTHYHRLPALRGLFKPLLRRLVHKMLHRDMWSYWYLTSQSGIMVDPSLKELRRPWANPVVRENIMYSGHLLLMTSLYAMLFDDDEFERAGSLSFRWNTLLWGMGPKMFEYDNRSLQKAVLEEMKRNEWVGVCCEPNLVFVACNQFPIIAIRMNDVRDGTNVLDEVLEKYKSALEKHGMISRNDLYKDWLMLKQSQVVTAKSVGFTAWAAAFINSWNPEFVRVGFTNHATGFITNIDGQIELQNPMVAGAYGATLARGGTDLKDPSQILQDAREFYKANRSRIKFPYNEPTFGYVVQWLSELGKRRTDGQKKLFDGPWTKDILADWPYVDGLDLSQGVDCLRGLWDQQRGDLILTVREWTGRGADIAFDVKNLPSGIWTVFTSRGHSTEHDFPGGGQISVNTTVHGKEEIDFVVFRRA
ncbi:uncharacterized protein KD926_009890 [Aspergillus affinis]|uniref:uncharacterized protein n=1 Tax=Aspergillus affinis TaxID=1070780 RepID=UPI0022FF2B71|nr:uncharacterized protein KD926_009890 [Aspergillus affinis]KAI9039141.1 hypothetical protein KD926_009890 [Aspergillus affinis]